MAQQQIKGATGDLGSGGSLDVYDVPGSVIVTPYSVSATFDGTGASGSFLPCLTFKTQTGAVIARCPAPEVASGNVAEASWFPHVAQASAPAPPPVSSGIQWAYIDSTEAPVACPSGTSTRIAADATTFYTNAPSVYDASNFPGGVLGIRILADGHYMVAMSALATTPLVTGDVAQLVIEGGGEFVDFGFQFPIDFSPVSGFTAGTAQTGGVMSIGGFIKPPTHPIICRIDNQAGGHTLHYSYTGLVIWQLDDVNQDL